MRSFHNFSPLVLLLAGCSSVRRVARSFLQCGRRENLESPHRTTRPVWRLFARYRRQRFHGRGREWSRPHLLLQGRRKYVGDRAGNRWLHEPDRLDGHSVSYLSGFKAVAEQRWRSLDEPKHRTQQHLGSHPINFIDFGYLKGRSLREAVTGHASVTLRRWYYFVPILS